ncbi:NAD(P)H-hydrate dehydratase [Murdochiella massiliensis]|uniref:NAD(P)H-hydrate dehydratase n=1 Tax=Murdochiella massiliensis TaxID=1673723 RepID=UPI0008353B54|nr:NAD(P)H-hydrate dehydratase [Murdochiella massiliensis]
MIGIDVVDIARFATGKQGSSFLHRVFTVEERRYIENSPHPVETMAGLYAAKEAIGKALGTGIGSIPFHAMEIIHDDTGKPQVRLHGEASKQLKRCCARQAEIAITHDAGVAVAVCVLIPNQTADPSFAVESPLFRNQLSPSSAWPSARALALLHAPGGQHRELAASLLRRDRTGYKTQYGKVAVIGGSRGMVGSVYLAAEAALRSGAGLVYAVVPESIASAVQNKLLEAIVRPIPDDGCGHFTVTHLPDVLDAVSDCSSVAIGPGMSRFTEATSFVADVLEQLSVPCVIDADAINALAPCPERLKTLEQDIVLTPHEMEMRRISGKPLNLLRAHRRETAERFAVDFRAFVVLKGADTVITDGKHTTFNPSGTPGMATAGSGDVLTGMLAAFLGAGYPTRTAARLACDLHGLAGEFAAEAVGEECMIASDLLKYLPTAFRLFHVLREQEEHEQEGKGDVHAKGDQR